MSDSSAMNNPAFPGDAILNRVFLTPEQRRDPAEGQRILKQFWALETSKTSSVNSFRQRNLRWREVLQWTKGSQDIRELLGYMNISDADKAYLSIDTTQSRLGPQFMGTLVDSMAKVKVYACVKAIDDGSLTEKEQRYQDSLYRMNEVGTIASVQQASGVQVEPTNAYVPNDELAARVYYEIKDQLPKEIRFEKTIQIVQNDIKFETIQNRKTLYDMAAINFGALKVEKLGPKKYTIRVCTSTNMLYNFFINDNGEAQISLIGEWTSIKVKDFRSRFKKSKSNPTGLTEKEIFDLAKLSSHESLGKFNFDWSDSWAIDNTFTRSLPYDDSNITVFDGEVDFGEDLYYVEKTDKRGRVKVEQKKGVPYQTVDGDGKVIYQDVPDNVEIKKRRKQTWMRGVYAPYGDKMLYWGEPDVIISHYTDVFKPLSSYVVSKPNNDGEYVPSLIERAMDCFRDYQLTKLKRRQIIALIEPDGFTIDVALARNLDLGSGDSVGWEEVLRIKNQTGVQLYSSEGVDPMQKEGAPVNAGVQTTNISKVIELTNAMAGILNEIRQLLGVPQYRDGSDVGDRTAAALAEGQNTNSFNVTDFVAVANNQMWSEAFYRICLLNWIDIVKTEPESKDDLLNTRFDVKVEIKSTDYERQRLEADIQRFSQMPDAQGNPSLSPKDAMMLREIGAENYKLANLYMTTVFESNRKHAIQESERLQQQNAQLQSQTAQQTAQQEQELQAQKLQAEKDMLQFKHSKAMELALLQGYTGVWVKTGVVDPLMLPVIKQLVPNIGIPLQQENQQMGQMVAAAAQQQAQPGQEGQAPPQQPGGQPMPSDPSQQTQPQTVQQ